jgi:L-ascorbate metabolism protein UlaG (beta-lactamase superfamily)
VVTIYYEENAQVEIIGPDGTRVLIDVYDPTLLSSPATKNDILLTTHTHYDHVNDAFLASFEGQQLYIEEGEITQSGVTIRGIASAHNSSDEMIPAGGTNYIYLIEVGGLRIAHFGDIGQDALTQDQLDILGSVDVAITQLWNDYSGMSEENAKGFNLIEQFSPRLIIPTHNVLQTAQMAAERWPAEFAQTSVVVSRSTLPAETTVLFMGFTASGYEALFGE